MSKLWTFGCSISDLYDSETSKYYWSADYLKWKGYTPKHYTEIIADKLSCELKNFGVSSTNNYAILQSICDNIINISDDDYVIIQWTESTRFRLSGDDNRWVNFIFKNSQNKNELKNNKSISIQTIQEILINRTHTLYDDEILSWEKLLKKNINEEKLILWNPFKNVGEYGKMLKSIENISTETNGMIDDPHFSENGQVHLAGILLDKLLNNTKNII